VTERWIETVIKARFLVACLGEYANPPWWRSQALAPAGRRLAERLYPRTYLAACLDTSGRAAAIEHDNHIGHVTAYHLFRLPADDERALHEAFLAAQGTELLRSLAAIEGVDRQITALADLAAGVSAPGTRGAVRCGSSADLHRDVTIQRMCAAYARGYRAGVPTFPYLDYEGQA
jgi:hypothetical protein